MNYRTKTCSRVIERFLQAVFSYRLDKTSEWERTDERRNPYELTISILVAISRGTITPICRIMCGAKIYLLVTFTKGQKLCWWIFFKLNNGEYFIHVSTIRFSLFEPFSLFFISNYVIINTISYIYRNRCFTKR